MTSSDRRTYLRREFLRLGIGEFAAVVVFLVVAQFSSWFAANPVAFWAALMPVMIILTQAGI